MSKAVDLGSAAMIAAEGPRCGGMIGLNLKGYTLWEISCSVGKARKHLLDLAMRYNCILWGPMQYVTGTGGAAPAPTDRASLLIYFPSSMGNDDVTCAVIDLFGHRDVWVMGPKRWPVQSHGALLAPEGTDCGGAG